MKSRKGCVMGTSIHKGKSSDGSPMNFLGRGGRQATSGAVPGAVPAAGGTIEEMQATSQSRGDAKSSGKMGLKALLNPAGAIANKMGMGDTAIGVALNPLSLLNR